MNINVEITDAAFFSEWKLPQHEDQGAAGIDIRAALLLPLTIWPDQRRKIPTSLKVEVPQGYVMLLYPRSGLGHEKGLILGNGTGVIDSSFRGEILVSLWNTGDQPHEVRPGDRIAQAVVIPYLTVQLCPVSTLSETSRGDGGFGSTGVN